LGLKSSASSSFANSRADKKPVSASIIHPLLKSQVSKANHLLGPPVLSTATVGNFWAEMVRQLIMINPKQLLRFRRFE
jgi:hypothetical protein